MVFITITIIDSSSELCTAIALVANHQIIQVQLYFVMESLEIECTPLEPSSSRSSTYFNTLPNDVSDDLVRWLQSSYAASHGTSSLLDVLFDSRSPFLESSTKMFKNLTFSSASQRPCINNRLVLSYSLEPELTERITRKCGDTFETVAFTELTDVCLDQIKRCVDGVIKYCKSVINVGFSGILQANSTKYVVDAIVSKFGSKIQLIELSSTLEIPPPSMPIGSIANSCTALKRFRFYGYGLAQLFPLWPAVGPRLEEIVIESCQREFWALTVSLLQAYCRNLKRITLDNPYEDHVLSETSYTALFVSYGEQLERALLSDMSAESCAMIANSCPNLRCSFQEFDNEFSCIAALEHRLEMLQLHIDEAPGNWNELSSAMRSTAEMEEFNLSIHSIVDHDILKHAFPIRMARLERLNISLEMGTLHTKSLNSVACNTGSLQNVGFRIRTIIDNDAFEEVARANRNIQVVEILELEVNGRSMEQLLRLIRGVVKAFLYCPSMKHFQLGVNVRVNSAHNENAGHFERMISSEMMPFKHRRVSTQIILGLQR